MNLRASCTCECAFLLDAVLEYLIVLVMVDTPSGFCNITFLSREMFTSKKFIDLS